MSDDLDLAPDPVLKKSRRPNPAERAEMVELMLAGYSSRSIGEKLGRPHTTVCNIYNDEIDKYRAQRGGVGGTERLIESHIQVHKRNIALCQRGARDAARLKDTVAENNYIRTMNAEMRAIERIIGADAPTKLDVTGSAGAGFIMLSVKETIIPSAHRGELADGAE